MRCPTLNEGYLETSTTLRIRNLDTDKGQEKSLDGTYRKMLRMVLGISWKVSNVTLYGNLSRLSNKLQLYLTVSPFVNRAIPGPGHQVIS